MSSFSHYIQLSVQIWTEFSFSEISWCLLSGFNLMPIIQHTLITTNFAILCVSRTGSRQNIWHNFLFNSEDTHNGDKACLISMPGTSSLIWHTSTQADLFQTGTIHRGVSNRLHWIIFSFALQADMFILDEMKGVQTYSAAIMPSPVLLYRFKVGFSILKELMELHKFLFTHF